MAGRIKVPKTARGNEPFINWELTAEKAGARKPRPAAQAICNVFPLGFPMVHVATTGSFTCRPWVN